MIKTFTENDLVRFLYQETSDQERQEICNALLCDADLRVKLQEMQQVKLELDAAALEPSPAAILNILSYAKAVSSAGN